MEIIDLERDAASGTRGVLARISPLQWSFPTPCPDWTIERLIAHVIAGNVKYTEIGGGGDWSRGAPYIEVDDDPVAKYAETFDAMLEAWQRPGVLDREITLPRGRGRAEEALFIHLGETLVHGWDLAVAASLEPVFDDAVVEASLSQYRSWLPKNRPAESPFGDATPIEDDAPAIERLAAYLGREVRAWRV